MLDLMTQEMIAFLSFQIYESVYFENDGPMVQQIQMAECFHNWLSFGGQQKVQDKFIIPQEKLIEAQNKLDEETPW